MKKPTLAAVLLPAVLLVALVAADPGAANAQPGAYPAQPKMAASLCQAPEIALFSCAVGSQTVSICGHKEQNRATYRFGRPDHVELEVTDLHVAEHAFSGGGETQVYADTSADRYIVYDRVVRTSIDDDGRHDPQETSGVVVQKAGGTISSRLCTQPVTFGQLTRTLVPAGNYVPH